VLIVFIMEPIPSSSSSSRKEASGSDAGTAVMCQKCRSRLGPIERVCCKNKDLCYKCQVNGSRPTAPGILLVRRLSSNKINTKTNTDQPKAKLPPDDKKSDKPPKASGVIID